MARKQMIEGGTKNRIREVGGRQIFEHGYDGTSVRGIMLEVGGEVGLFYYYYKTKDELFTDVLDHFFEPYRKDLEALAARGEGEAYRALLRFFSYIKREVRAFRAKYEGNMHRTVRWAIREQTLTVIEPYIEDIIRTLMTCGAKPDDGPAHHGHFPRARPGELHPARGCRLGGRGDGRYAPHGQPHHGAQRGGVPQNV